MSHEREDIRAIGTNERVGVNLGLNLVLGSLSIKSADSVLDKHLETGAPCQLVAMLKKSDVDDSSNQTYAFDEVIIERKSFAMNASIGAISTYEFSATRFRNE